MKPIRENDLAWCLKELQSHLSSPSLIQIQESSGQGISSTRAVILDDLLYAETVRHGLIIHTIRDEIHTRLTFSDLVSLLPKSGRFYVSGRGLLLNFSQVKTIRNTGEVFLKNGQTIFSPKKRIKETQDAFSSYYPLRRQLRFSLKTVILIIRSTQLLQCSIYAWLSAGGRSVRATDFIFAGSCFFIYFLCVSANPWKLLFLYIFNFDYVMLVFLRKTKNRVFQTDSPVFWKTVWLMSAFTTIIVLMFTTSLSPEYITQLRFLLARLLLLLGIFVVYYILLHALDGIRLQAALEEQTAQQETLLSLQRTQYQQLSRHITEVIQARHDLRQHLRIIRTYLKNHCTDQLSEYIAQYEQSLPSDVELTLCRNFAVNTIVCYFREEAGKAGIDFSVYLDLPEHLAVSEPDFCSVVGNLLENALNACRKVTDVKPFIRIRAEEDSDHIALVVDNSCSEPMKRQGGQICSTSFITTAECSMPPFCCLLTDRRSRPGTFFPIKKVPHII